jgi:plasmid maintenance system killer protein
MDCPGALVGRSLVGTHRGHRSARRCGPASNHLEPLKGDRKGQHSLRINQQYRLCFEWTDNGPAGVEIVDYH